MKDAAKIATETKNTFVNIEKTLRKIPKLEKPDPL